MGCPPPAQQGRLDLPLPGPGEPGTARSGTVLGAACCSSRCPSLAGPTCRPSRREPLHSLPESKTPHFLCVCTGICPTSNFWGKAALGEQGLSTLAGPATSKEAAQTSLRLEPRAPFKPLPRGKKKKPPSVGGVALLSVPGGLFLAPLVVQPIWTQVVCTAVSAL